MNQFMSGAIMMGCFVIGLFFLKFWRKTRERLFCSFASSFFLLSFERWCLITIPISQEAQSLIYLIRLAAFLIIIYGVVDKNRGAA